MKKGITLLCSALLLCGMSAVIGNAQDAAQETPAAPAAALPPCNCTSTADASVCRAIRALS